VREREEEGESEVYFESFEVNDDYLWKFSSRVERIRD